MRNTLVTGNSDFGVDARRAFCPEFHNSVINGLPERTRIRRRWPSGAISIQYKMPLSSFVRGQVAPRSRIRVLRDQEYLPGIRIFYFGSRGKAFYIDVL